MSGILVRMVIIVGWTSLVIAAVGSMVYRKGLISGRSIILMGSMSILWSVRLRFSPPSVLMDFVGS